MSAASELHAPVVVTELTTDKFGDVNLWIGKGKQYHNVPSSRASSQLLRRCEAHVQAMYDQPEGLWRRLGVPDAAMDGFVDAHRGSTEETVREYEAELERMLKLQRERMSAFVENARGEIAKLWDELLIGDEERSDFTPYFDDEHTEELELSTLVRMRFKHQSEEEASSKINEIIKTSSELAQTGSTGLNHRNRWTTEKAAAGSFPAGSDSTASGNVANAQAAARRSANNIVKQRGSAFASLKNANSLESAKIGLLVSLTNRCFGLAVVDDNLVLVEVLTMYEKSGAKNAKHSWTSSTTSIGALSYLVVWCYQHIRQRQFRTMECMATRTMHFAHLPSLAFLCMDFSKTYSKT
ncbi:microtubule associated protein-domain-containing protein [Lactarius deliciosus]|nr:microtubule associated protein-domain-containing protein [Lactarius deliciosus]